MALLSKGITLAYGSNMDKVLTNLQEIPDVGKTVRNREKIDITTLADDEKKEMDGLKEAMADETLAFKFLYEQSQFLVLQAIEDEQMWVVNLPDGTMCIFSGIPSVKLDGAGTSKALTYTLNIKLTSEMAWES